MIAGGAYLSRGYDSADAATWATFPWHILFAIVCGAVMLLAGANADSIRFSGTGGTARLVRRILVALVLAMASAGLPICVAILRGRSMGDTISYALAGLLVMQALGLVLNRFSDPSGPT